MADTIALRDVIIEDFCNYKLPSMFLISSYCDWKCCHEANIDESVCQNHGLVSGPIKQISYESLYQAYISNDITKAIVIGGLEPMLQIDEVVGLIHYFREKLCQDTFVIYTGYYPYEIPKPLSELKKLHNITIKYGRYDPKLKAKYDDILGVMLVSENQYGEVLS